MKKRRKSCPKGITPNRERKPRRLRSYERTLRTIRRRLDIVRVIRDYGVALQPFGQDFISLCPFHADRMMSFMISPKRRTFHCYGCGTGGDVVSFVMKMDAASFSRTITKLASKVGINIPKSRRQGLP